MFLARYWPKVLHDPDGYLWTLKGTTYVKSVYAKAWAVDDAKGTLYFVRADGRLKRLSDSGESTLIETSNRVIDVQASEGTIYWLAADGRVWATDNRQTIKLGKAPAHGELLATQGYLYMLDKDRDLFSYHNGNWLNNGQPIARHVLQVTARGQHWFGLDGKRNVYSGDLGRYIDRDGDAVALRAVGIDLLLFNADGRLFRFDAAAQKWRGMAR